ncbi:MAG: transporter [Proteobacteria bacterium]|nr:transporter [Pseudomonadota bacterium]
MFFEVGAALDGTPVFRSVAQDLGHTVLGGTWAPHPSVELRGSLEALAVRHETWTIGAGDIRLGTAARAWSGRGAAPAIWLDWQVKLPNADDATGLGTDETDTRGLVLARWAGPRWHAQFGAGLEILGDPNHHAAQEDRMAAQTEVGWAFGASQVRVGVDAAIFAPHFPAEVEARIGVEHPVGDRLRVGAQGTVGLTDVAYAFGGAFALRLVPGEARP